MKPTLLLLPFLLCAVQFCKGQQVDDVHQKKAAEIIQRVASGEPLPKGIKDWSKGAQKAWGKHRYELSYRTVRLSNSQEADSVDIGVSINDTLMNLEFHEIYFRRNVGVSQYHYNVVNGEITYAYNSTELPDSLKKQVTHYKDGSVGYPMNAKVDSTLMINKRDSLWTYDNAELEKHKERDRRSFAFYEPKLLKSIDELYDLLFK
jgi:hypothetical protein